MVVGTFACFVAPLPAKPAESAFLPTQNNARITDVFWYYLTTMEQQLAVVTGGADLSGRTFVSGWWCRKGMAVISPDNYFSGTKDNHVPERVSLVTLRDIAPIFLETPTVIFILVNTLHCAEIGGAALAWDLNTGWHNGCA